MIKQWFAVSALAVGGALVGLACTAADEEEVDLAGEQAAGSEEQGLDPVSGCDRLDPDRTYFGESEAECATIRFYCKEGTTYFADECGCGCATTEIESEALERGAIGGGEDANTLCGGEKCAAGEECIGYYGIAGREGRMHHTCGIRCGLGVEGGCPAGKRCVTIADGPGPLCL